MGRLTSSAALRGVDSSRLAALSVRGSPARHPGSLPAQPPHALRRFTAQDDQGAGLAIAGMFDPTIPGREGAAFPPRPEARGLHAATSMRVIEYRDIRPDGVLLSDWRCPEGREFVNDYSQFGPGMQPGPPYDTQRREPGGEWVTVYRLRADGQKTRRETLAPDGAVTFIQEWWME